MRQLVQSSPHCLQSFGPYCAAKGLGTLSPPIVSKKWRSGRGSIRSLIINHGIRRRRVRDYLQPSYLIHVLYYCNMSHVRHFCVILLGVHLKEPTGVNGESKSLVGSRIYAKVICAARTIKAHLRNSLWFQLVACRLHIGDHTGVWQYGSGDLRMYYPIFIRNIPYQYSIYNFFQITVLDSVFSFVKNVF